MNRGVKRLGSYVLIAIVGLWALTLALAALGNVFLGDFVMAVVILALALAPVGWMLWRRRRKAATAAASVAPGPQPEPIQAVRTAAEPPPTAAVEPPPTAVATAEPERPKQSGLRRPAFVAGLLLLALVIGAIALAVSDSGNEERASSAATTERRTATTEPAAPATTKAAEPAESTTEAEPSEPPADSGRLSDSEFDRFQRAQAEVIDESLQFSDEIQACSVIGQTGDFSGFRDCVGSAYSGFEEDSDFALYTAQDLIDDAGGKCQRALKSYVVVGSDYAAAVKTSYEVANRLDFEAMTVVYQDLPRQTQRYSKFTLNAARACKPSP